MASPIAATHNCLWAVQYSNSNTYANPKAAFDITAVGDADTDEDWLRVVSSTAAPRCAWTPPTPPTTRWARR